LILLARRLQDRRNARGWLRDGLLLLVCSVVCLGPAVAWTRYADALKSENPIAQFTTSTALTKWNFGTIEQRFTWKAWRRIFSFPVERDYHPALFAAAAVGALLARRRWRQILVCLLLYLSAPFVFTNLHYAHWYYAYPNLVFLLLAVGLVIVALLERPDWRPYVGAALLACTIVFSIYRHQTSHADRQAAKKWSLLAAAASIARVTEPDEIVIIYGHQWSPVIPYYARRRALMLPSFITSEAANQALADLAGQHVGAMLVVTDRKAARGWYPKNYPEAVLEQVREYGLSTSVFFSDGTSTLYFARRHEQVYQNLQIAQREMARGKFRAAEMALTTAIKEQPRDPNLFEQRAICRLNQRDLPAALADYDAATRLDPPHPKFYADQATALMAAIRELRAGQDRTELLDRALRCVDRAIDMDARQPRFFKVRSQVNVARGERDLAKQDLNKANALSQASGSESVSESIRDPSPEADFAP